MLVETRELDGVEIAAPEDAKAAVRAVAPLRPTFLGMADTSMGAPAPDKGGVAEFVEGLMTSTGLTLLGAEEGTGKSLVSNSLCVAAALNDPAQKVWCDYQVLTTGRSLLVMAEGKEAMHKQRHLGTLLNTFKLDPQSEEFRTANDRVEIFSMRSRIKTLKEAHPHKKFGRRLFHIPAGMKSGEYVATPMLEAILDHIRSVNDWARCYGTPEDRIVVVVFDTLQALFGVSLIDDEAINDVMQFLNIELDALGCAGLVTAHTNKSSKAEDDDPRAAIKGSQQVMATAESVILLRSMTEAEWEDTTKAGLDMPRDKALAIKPGKSNSRTADRGTKLLMGLPNGAPVGITERVGRDCTGGGMRRGGYTATEIKAAVVSLFQILWNSETDPRISANRLYAAAQDAELIAGHNLSALKYITAEGSRGGKNCVKVSDALKEAANDGILRAVRSGNGYIYHRTGE